MIRFLQTETPAKKIVLGALLLVICVTMVITLIPGGILNDSGAGGQGTLARVAGHDVSTLEVEQLARRMEKQQFPRGLPEQFLPYMMQQAANSVITQKAMLAEADRMGLRVTDAELANELHAGQFGQVLFPGGKFVGQEAYEDFVANQFGMSKTQFEQALKFDLVMRKLSGAIEAGVTVSGDDVRKEFQKQNTKVKLQYAVLTLQDVQKQVQTTDAELKAFYEANKATRYANAMAEKRTAKYILVTTADALALAKAKLKPEDLQQYYNSHQDEFKLQEQATVSHILIKTPPPGPDGKPDQKGVDAARAKAEDILKKLRAGADFAELAKKESQDPGSAKNGGSLGSIGRGATVAEFEQAAFSQPVGKIGDLVKTQFGFHIIRVDQRQEARLKPFAEAKDEAATRLGMQRADAEAQALVKKIETEAHTSGMEAAATDSKLPLQTADGFSRTDSLPGVGADPEFHRVAFSAPKNGTPQTAKMAQGYGIILVTGVQPARTPTLDEIKARVENDFKQERASQMLAQKTQELADRAHAQHDLAKAAKELGATVKTSELVTPDSQVPDLGALSQAPVSSVFDLKKSEISGPLNIGSGGAVVAVVEKQEASEQDFSKQRDQIREQLVGRKRQERMQMFAGDLRARLEKEGKIKINKEEWTRVVGSPPKTT